MRWVRTLAVALAGAGMGLLAFATGASTDDILFLHAGHSLITGQLAQVFSDPDVQVGPLYLLLAGSLGALASLVHVGAPLLLAITTSALVAGACLHVLRRANPAGLDARSELAAAAVVVVGGPLLVAAMPGHPEEIGVVLLLIAATGAGGKGQWLGAGALVGAAGSTKLWGLLGVAVLIVVPTVADRLRAGVVAAGVVCAAYAPFFLAGNVSTFQHSWPIGGASPLSLVLPIGSSVTYALRLGQGLVVVLSIVGAGLLLRRNPSIRWWALPMLVVAVRALTDPILIPYYWAPALVALALGMCSGLNDPRTRWMACVAAGIPILTLWSQLPELLRPVVGGTSVAFAVGNAAAAFAMLAGVSALAGRRVRSDGVLRPSSP